MLQVNIQRGGGGGGNAFVQPCATFSFKEMDKYAHVLHLPQLVLTTGLLLSCFCVGRGVFILLLVFAMMRVVRLVTYLSHILLYRHHAITNYHKRLLISGSTHK